MNILKNVPQSVFGFLKYAIVWWIGTWVDVFIVYILAIRLEYPLYWSTAIAFVAAASNNFVLNKIWTFRDVWGRYKRQYMKFLLVSTLGLWLTLISMGILVELLHFPIIVAKLTTSVIVLSWNFLANKYWTFATKLTLDYIDSGSKYPLFLSIIIPAYNETHRISYTLSLIAEWKTKSPFSDSIEIIVVNDGSTDNTSDIVREHPLWAQLIENSENRWAAVATWVSNANGKYALIFDADSSTPITEIEKLLPYVDKYDFVIWSRYKESSIIRKKQSLFRRFISRSWSVMIQSILIDDIQDTQCGFKLFHTDKGRAIFEKQKIYRWGFDIEMLFLARSFGFSIKEIWVEWTNSPDSRFRALRDSLRTFYELISIKFFAWFGGYN
jgi:dolichyl-phosphate beta-glucosyltransferase